MVRDEDREHKIRDVEEFRGARLQILGTNADKPDEGRIFVWTKMGWFERIEGEDGNVTFDPVALNEKELRELITRDDPAADLYVLGGNFKKMVYEEFTDEWRPHHDSPYITDDDQTGEDSQEYHQHDL